MVCNVIEIIQTIISMIIKHDDIETALLLCHKLILLSNCTCDKVCQWLATGQWFSPGTPVSSTINTDRHDITEILLKMAFKTIKQTKLINYCDIYHLYLLLSSLSSL